ncbi:hypothetical protein [Pseudomonas cavernae]|uniref:hypothetical protein n=1 Tax=Pseudomonas cavernae TaxID=2320867 RepID=UPI0013C45F87|nr:hypothetical protein [Pseudomonas cavernae]
MLPENYTALDPDFTTTSVPLRFSRKTTPKDYYHFAIQDLSIEPDTRSLVNALSNTKRALHLQVEMLSTAFGLDKFSKKAKSFPAMVDFLSSCGLVTPRILSKINKLRNLVEHEYHIPEKDEVENFIDVTELFIAATEKYIKNFPCGIEFLAEAIDPNHPQISYVDLEPYEGVITFSHGLVANTEGHDWEKSEIHAPDPAYFKWVKFIVDNS